MSATTFSKGCAVSLVTGIENDHTDKVESVTKIKGAYRIVLRDGYKTENGSNEIIERNWQCSAQQLDRVVNYKDEKISVSMKKLLNARSILVANNRGEEQRAQIEMIDMICKGLFA